METFPKHSVWPAWAKSINPFKKFLVFYYTKFEEPNEKLLEWKHFQTILDFWFSNKTFLSYDGAIFFIKMSPKKIKLEKRSANCNVSKFYEQSARRYWNIIMKNINWIVKFGSQPFYVVCYVRNETGNIKRWPRIIEVYSFMIWIYRLKFTKIHDIPMQVSGKN